jgi:hypothetical protein
MKKTDNVWTPNPAKSVAMLGIARVAILYEAGYGVRDVRFQGRTRAITT